MVLSIPRLIAVFAILLTALNTSGGRAGITMMEICSGTQVRMVPVSEEAPHGHVTCDICCVVADTGLPPVAQDLIRPAPRPETIVAAIRIAEQSPRNGVKARGPPFI